MAAPADRVRLFKGKPEYLGYITSAFKVNAGRNAADPHAEWESKIAPRVRDRISKDLAAIDPALVPQGGNKIGGVKNFHSLAPAAQKYGVALAPCKERSTPVTMRRLQKLGWNLGKFRARLPVARESDRPLFKLYHYLLLRQAIAA